MVSAAHYWCNSNDLSFIKSPFVDEETEAERFSNMPRTTQLVTNWWSLELNLEECGPKIYASTTSRG